MDTAGNALQTFGAVVYGIERHHRGQQRLRRAHVGSRLVAFDMLFACLQSHAQRLAAIDIFGYADDASRHRTFIFVAGGKKSRRRTAEEHRDAEPLRTSESDIRPPLARRRQQGQRHQIGSDGYFAAGSMCLFDKAAIVFDAPITIGILYDGSEEIFSAIELLIVADDNLNVVAIHAGMQHSQRLREYIFIDKQLRHIGFHLFAATQGMHHTCSFAGSRSLVQQGTVGQRQSREFAHHRLKIQQRFEPPLRYLRLIWRIGRIPYRIFEYVAVDNCRSDGIVPAHADVGCKELVFGGDAPYFFGILLFRQRRRQR